MVRGVFIPTAGQHTVHFTYRPASFVYGAYLSLATAALLVFLALGVAVRRKWGRDAWRSDPKC